MSKNMKKLTSLTKKLYLIKTYNKIKTNINDIKMKGTSIMRYLNFEKYVKTLLTNAGITLNGNLPWDIQIHDERIFWDVISRGSLAFGEGFMKGLWSSGQLDTTMTKILTANLDHKFDWSLGTIPLKLFSFMFNAQNKKRALEVANHYNTGNDLFAAMLDKRMVYTCAYWTEGAQDLDQAQEAKLDLICRKIDLREGMKVLDIGCGWGSFAKYAAEKYDAHVTGITISEEQAKLARELCEGLPVEIKVMDYRDVSEQFDCIVSIGMFEAVGYRNYRTYMEVVHRCLKEDGLFLLHTIGGDISVKHADPWFNYYIFANGMMPSPAQIANAIEGIFSIEDWHNIGPHYDLTLMAWFARFVDNWESLKATYEQQANGMFFNMWTYYLLTSAASFRARKNQLWQIVLSKGDIPKYESIR